MDDPGGTTRQRSLLFLLTRVDFALLWTGGVAMAISRQLWILLSAQWLYDKTGSAAHLGMLGFVQLLQMPMVIYGGALADIFDRKKIMMLTQGAMFILLALTSLLAYTDALLPRHIFVVTGLSGLLHMLGASSRPAMLPRVVPRPLITQAVSTQVVSSQIATIGAPLVFWQTYELLGIAPSLAIAGLLSLFSAIAPMFMKTSGAPETRRSHKDTLRSIREGFRFVFKHPVLPGLYLLDIGIVVVSFYRTLFPIFADQLYGMGAEGTGLLNASNATGAIIGTLLVLWTGRIQRKGRLVLFAMLVYAVLLALFGINRVFFVGLGIMWTLGVLNSISATMRKSIVQMTTPDELIGRVSAANTFASMGANNLGQIEVGLLSGAIGAGKTMVLGSIISLFVVGAIWRFMPGVRKYRYDPIKSHQKPEAADAEAQSAKLPFEITSPTP